MAELVRCKKAYKQFLFQKAKNKWLKEGDANTRFFHQSIKLRKYTNRVIAIQDMEGQWCNEQ